MIYTGVGHSFLVLSPGALPSPPKIKLAMLGYNPMNGLIETGKFGMPSVGWVIFATSSYQPSESRNDFRKGVFDLQSECLAIHSDH